MRSLTAGMMPLAKIFREHYGLDLFLLADGKIRIRARRKVYADNLRKQFEWIMANRDHVIERLKYEGWDEGRKNRR